MHEPTPLAKIIDALGVSTLQKAFGHENASTVSSWKIRGSIPVEHWPRIIEVARAARESDPDKHIPIIDYEALVVACAARKAERVAAE